MLPAGEMWSVVTESPKMPSGRASTISVMWPGSMREVREEGRLLDVGALLVPGVGLAGRAGDVVPRRILLGEVAVESCGRLRAERRACVSVLTSCERGPDVLEVNRLAVLAGAERLRVEVDIDAAGEGEGDDERRRHEEVRLDVRVDARLEVAVAGEDAGGDEIVLGDGLVDDRIERAGIADAGGAAVADDLEAELVEVGLQAGLVEVIGDDAGAGRERGLHRGIDRQAALDRLLGEQAGGEHDARDCWCWCNW